MLLVVAAEAAQEVEQGLVQELELVMMTGQAV